MQYGDESFSRTLCQCVGLVNATQIREFVHTESQTDDQKTKLMNNFCEKVGLILNQKGSWCFKFASYHLLHRFVKASIVKKNRLASAFLTFFISSKSFIKQLM